MYTTMLYYTCEDDCDDIMTLDGIKKAWEYEKMLNKHSKYPKTCLATSSSDLSCKSDGWSSITKFFEAKLIANTLTQTDIDNFKNDLISTPATWNTYKSMIGKDFTSSNKKTKYLSGYYQFGTPLDVDGTKYKSRNDRPLEQEAYVADY